MDEIPDEVIKEMSIYSCKYRIDKIIGRAGLLNLRNL